MPVKELCRRHGFSDAAFYGWRTKFTGMRVDEAKRLKSLEHENVSLKRLLADSMLGHRGAEGGPGPKTLTPQDRRAAVAAMRERTPRQNALVKAFESGADAWGSTAG